MAHEEFEEYENLLLQDKRKLKEEVQEMKIVHNKEIRALRMKHTKAVARTRKHFDEQFHLLERKYDKRIGNIYSAVNLKNRTELSEIEERKNLQINELLKNHEEALHTIRNYYNDITLNNLALINSLKEEVQVLKENEEQMKKRSREIVAENQKIVEPLRKAEATVVELQKKLKHYELQKERLSTTKQRLDASTKELKELKWTHDVVLTQLAKVRSERNELRDRFSEIIVDLHQKAGMRNLILHNKVTALTQVLEQKDAQLSDILQSTADPARVNEMKQKLKVDKHLLDRKNAAIHDLQFQVARLCKANEDLLTSYETKLKNLGFPKEELGFVGLRDRMKKVEDRSGDLSSKDS